LFEREVIPEEKSLLRKIYEDAYDLSTDIFFFPFLGEKLRPEILVKMEKVVGELQEWKDKFGRLKEVL